MSDDVILNSGAGGDTIAADDIGGVKHQRTKVQFGADGSATDVGPLAPLPTVQAGAGAITSGTKTVATAGTAVRIIVSSTPCKVVWVSADLGNTGGPMVIGDLNVVAADSSQQGIVLIPGNPPTPIYVSDLNLLWVDAQTNGDKISYAYIN